MQFFRLLHDSLFESPKANLTIFSDYFRMGMVRYFKTSSWMVRDRIEKNLENTAVPTLVMRGERDPIVPRRWADYLRTLSPMIVFEQLPNAPHALHFKYAVEVAKRCKSFIG